MLVHLGPGGKVLSGLNGTPADPSSTTLGGTNWGQQEDAS